MSMMIPTIIDNALPLIIPTHDVAEGARKMNPYLHRHAVILPTLCRQPPHNVNNAHLTQFAEGIGYRRPDSRKLKYPVRLKMM